VVICDTRAERNLAGTEYDERRAQCEAGVALLREIYGGVTSLRDVTMEQFAAAETRLPAVVARRCRFILEENARVLALAAVLPAGRAGALQALFAASYAGARDLYEIGAPALEVMADAATQAPGAIAVRQAGAGFGGCMVALVEPGAVDAFRAEVRSAYRRRTQLDPHIYAVAPSPGAGELQL
jgi:galactokinase